jgi:hypothetical protein
MQHYRNAADQEFRPRCRDRDYGSISYKVKGTVEKIYENSSTGERSFDGENRTRGTVEGYIEKNYLGPDRTFLHIIEHGHGRESSHFYELTALSDSTMSGIFYSMVADQAGTVEWQRTAF